jgi:hypothetical protein
MWDEKAETALLPETCNGIEIQPTGDLQSIEVPGDLREIAHIAWRVRQNLRPGEIKTEETVMKNIRNFALLILVVAATVGANAQNSFTGKVQLPSEVRWDKSVLPAGEYSLSIPSFQAPVRLYIQSMDGKTAAIAVAQIANPEPGGNSIFVTGTGSNRLVRSMNLPQLGCSLVYAPITSREREKLYASVSQSLPVQMVKK